MDKINEKLENFYVELESIERNQMDSLGIKNTIRWLVSSVG